MNTSAEARFNQVALAYATSPIHSRGADLKWLVAALQPDPAWTVLDVGTGAGHAAFAVAPAVRRVVALDVAERMLEVAGALATERGLANVELVRSGAESMPFDAHSFDAAFSRFSAHHWPDPAACIDEIARVLKPRARFALADSAGIDVLAHDGYLNALELLRDPSHVRNATVAEWSRLLAGAGFTVELVRTWDQEIDTAAWLQRSATSQWRAAACRQLLAEAPEMLRTRMNIAQDGASFTLPCVLITAQLMA